MIAVAYLLPILACLLLRVEFNYSDGVQAYFLIFLFGEITVGGLHWLLYRYQSTAVEFLGSLVSSIYREDPWIELIRTTETKTDSNGRSYKVSRVKEKYHSEKFYFHTTINSRFSCGKDFFYMVADRWAIEGRHQSWSGSHIKGGRRYGIYYTSEDFTPVEKSDPEKWIPVTEKHRYTNKIRRSNSLFKYEFISDSKAKENGLCDYPEITNFDAPCILSRDVAIWPEIGEMFRRFNGRYACQWQMRLYILLFDSSRGVGVSELQRQYWQGGNKNEFIICMGLTSDNQIGWARAFSWADSQQIEVDVAHWLMSQSELNWSALYSHLLSVLPQWERKQFSDFNYIHLSLETWQVAVILLISLLENIIALKIALN